MSARIIQMGCVLLVVTVLLVTPATAQELRVFISVDMEGITGVVHGQQTSSAGADYGTARKWMAQDVNAAVQGALAAGATDIVVNDSHGGMRNILLSDLDPAATLISGAPKPLAMMQGVDATFDAVMFVGYHAKAGTANGVLDHTISGSTVYSISVNGIEMPELGLNALIAGAYSVPVVLVVGDKAVCEQAEQILGQNIITAAVKEAVGRYAAQNLSLEKSHALIREQAKKAIESRGLVRPYTLSSPYRIELAYLRSSQADMAMLVPGVERLGPRTVRIESDDFVVGFKFLRALIALAREN